MTRLILAGLGVLALAGCGNQNTALEGGALNTAASALSTYQSSGGNVEDTALAAAEGSLAVYKATPNPNAKVVAYAQQLLTAAQAASAAAKANPTDAAKAAESSAIASLGMFLLTSAPGNGVTPTTAPLLTLG